MDNSLSSLSSIPQDTLIPFKVSEETQEDSVVHDEEVVRNEDSLDADSDVSEDSSDGSQRVES